MLEVLQAHGFGQVCIEKALLGASESGDFTSGSSQVAGLTGLQGSYFGVECRLGLTERFWAECLLLPEP